LVVQLPPVRQTVQWLVTHWRPSQHSLDWRHESFSALQKQVPAEQVPQQQSSGRAQRSVATCDGGAAQAQKPLRQSLEQQSEARAQAAPRDKHWQVVAHDFVQQLAPVEQLPPTAVQSAQAPLSQRALQQSPSLVQAPPAATQAPAHTLPMRVKPGSQTKSQTPPLHVGDAFAGGTHGAQALPHDCGLALARQSSPQSWKPASQVTPHTPALQVARPFSGGGQGAQEPQCCGSFTVETQRMPQAVGAFDGQAATHPDGAHSGVAPPHVHDPKSGLCAVQAASRNSNRDRGPKRAKPGPEGMPSRGEAMRKGYA
jgi:hypothetical protein